MVMKGDFYETPEEKKEREKNPDTQQVKINFSSLVFILYILGITK